ncbi:Endo-1,4-beta-xylanase Z [Triticum urartu]|uniref:Endo-1,4-beta-xylanase Z n=1 Tax=Triticum urartu TaxID=4572 RepID=M8A9V8_TRIUA|nr:Endo-1,4-beta-xylanase Z [Triticum urartu]
MVEGGGCGGAKWRRRCIREQKTRQRGEVAAAEGSVESSLQGTFPSRGDEHGADGWYDYTAHTDCRGRPEPAQYNGGILKYGNGDDPNGYKTTETGVLSPAFVVYNLNKSTMYTFSGWVKLEGSPSALITARLAPDNSGTRCIGTVLARSDCWAFLKGGFVLDWPTQTSVIFFQNADRTPMKITTASASLQPFTTDQWSMHQKDTIRKMLAFVRSHRVMVRGHNIFWENQDATPRWVKGLSPEDLRSAVNTRIQSLMTRYRGEFAHWDVNNEMLHFNFYEQRLGANATMEFFSVAQDADPLATLFMNEYNVVETCDDASSTVDAYVARLKDLRAGGAVLEGIGLEGHFSRPNIPYMRAVLDKLATLNLPIWFTEIDINNKFDAQTQAVYLEQVLREAYAHPAVSGVMLWTALHEGGCYQMCLTDWNLKNLPVGDVVDRLLQEWQTGQVAGPTDAHGAYSFSGYLGEYVVTVNAGNTSKQATFSLSPGDETRHITVQI